MKTLTELAKKYKSDKGIDVASKHGYTLFYNDLFFPFKNKPTTFLEIGLKIGGPEHGEAPYTHRGDSPSIQMWQEYFNDIDLVGFDISDFSHQVDDKFSFVMGDSGSDEDMTRLANFRDQYNIILEDASHNSYHQQNAIKHLWNKLSPEGLFIIEDLHWQPDNIDFQVPHQVTTFDLFHQYFNRQKYIHSDVIPEQLMKQIKKESSYIMFFTSCIRHQAQNPGQLLVIKKSR